jgi:hypothetical protein
MIWSKKAHSVPALCSLRMFVKMILQCPVTLQLFDSEQDLHCFWILR